jgi:hypothetical protein
VRLCDANSLLVEQEATHEQQVKSSIRHRTTRQAAVINPDTGGGTVRMTT